MLLDKPFASAEITHTLKQMKDRKALGPDGLHACFLDKYWSILGDKDANTILDILNHGGEVSPFNDTNILLIPKIKHPISIKDYKRLCNVIYKLISKTIVNRLKSMSSIINDC